MIIGVLVYFEPQTAFIDDTVNETIPGLESAIATNPTIASTLPPPTSSATTVLEPPAGTTLETTDPITTVPVTTAPVTTVPVTTAPAALNSISASLQLASSTGAPVVVSSGEFISGEHSTSGTALVVALPDGSLVVRFEGLDTSNGPDLRVVLSPDDASGSADYSGRLILGELKGNIGDQNYVLDGDVDLTGFRSVVIWCERFSVAFGAAPIDVQP